MDRFFSDENVALYRLLASSTDVAQRRTILKLLADETAKMKNELQQTKARLMKHEVESPTGLDLPLNEPLRCEANADDERCSLQRSWYAAAGRLLTIRLVAPLGFQMEALALAAGLLAVLSATALVVLYNF